MKLRLTLLTVALVASVLTGGAATAPGPSPVDAAPSRAAASPHGCDPGEFCTYRNRNYTVMVDRMSSCVLHRSHGVFRSYVNNQTRGTRARFYNHVMKFLSFTKPAPDKGTTSLGGNDANGAYFILPC